MTKKQAIRKLDAGATDFETWFTAQFGPRPDCPTVAELRDLRSMLARAEIQQQSRLTWELQRQAALTSWYAAKQEETTS